jgi:probable addiction module antidote protein
MGNVKTTVWDPAASFEDNDASFVVAALGDIALAKGMAQLARDTRLGRERLYKALPADGKPSSATVLNVVEAVGLQSQAVSRHAQILRLLPHLDLRQPLHRLPPYPARHLRMDLRSGGGGASAALDSPFLSGEASSQGGRHEQSQFCAARR